MAIKVKEIRRSRSRDRTTNSATRELGFTAWYSPRVDVSAIDANAIEDAVIAHVRTILGLAPTDEIVIVDAQAGSLIFNHYNQEPNEEDEQVFDVTLGFGVPDAVETPEHGEFSFDLSMATSHITTSLGQIRTSGAPIVPGIGWNGEDVEGTDIMIPQFSWRETHNISAASVDLTFINRLMQCASNPVNVSPFRDFLAGEVLFAGCTGSLRSTSQYAITYAFVGSANTTVAGLQKAGWDYIWRLYEKNEDTATKWIVPSVAGTYVEQVYGRSNFTSLLGI